jgi:protein phosphatase
MPESPTQLPLQASRATEVDASPPAAPAKVALAVTAYGLTDRGQVRPANEDQFLIAALTKALQIQQTSLRQQTIRFSAEQGHLFIVADGMGGHQAGERASALAVYSIEKFMLETFKWFLHLQGSEGQTVLEEFQRALKQTDTLLIEEATHHSKMWGMGTTLTMAYSLDRDLFIVHVGDSRCYLWRQGQLHQLTKDHTIVQELVQRGHLQPEEASRHHLRHVITNVVGGTEPGVHPEVHKLRLEPGDAILLCSDGLTEMVGDEQIAAVFRADPEPRQACEQLVQQANARGGQDNVTVIVARYTAPGTV